MAPRAGRIRLCLGSAIVVALMAGCATPPAPVAPPAPAPAPVAPKPPSLGRAEHLDELGRPREAAELRALLARSAAGADRQALLFEAAQGFLSADAPQQAQAAEEGLRAASGGLGLVLDAQLRLQRGEALAAYGLLRSIDPAQVNEIAREPYLRTLAEALDRLGDLDLQAWPEAVSFTRARCRPPRCMAQAAPRPAARPALPASAGGAQAASAAPGAPLPAIGAGSAAGTAPAPSQAAPAVVRESLAQRVWVRTQLISLIEPWVDAQANQARLWQALERVPAAELRALRSHPLLASGPEDGRAWVDLALAWQIEPPLARQTAALDAWARQYPRVVVLDSKLLRRAEPAAGVAHVAAVLPLNSSDFGVLAKSVLAGARQAAPGPAALPIRVYPTDGSANGAIGAYQRAVRSGARAVIGPLTRREMAAFSELDLLPVPTVALNVFEEQASVVNLVQFGLSLAEEGRQIARLLSVKQVKDVLLVQGKRPLDQRVGAAFLDQWTVELGANARPSVAEGSAGVSAWLNGGGTARGPRAVVLATGAELAMDIIRSLPADVPLYGTSSLFELRDDTSAGRTQVLELPYMIDAATDIAGSGSRDLLELRLFALGKDAATVAHALAAGDRAGAGQTLLVGATGRSIMLRSGRIERELTLTRLQQLRAVAQELTPEKSAEKQADKGVEKVSDKPGEKAADKAAVRSVATSATPPR
ncbi:penicillin-binding protein activator [Piscinibacterium candidicorallinum]|uniref:Penicillin-binding protein activator n=1 Tax=Piscinibacterium candidicorallinum TaxID=1793872 RepID=A0ABV7H137_9BURK